MFGQSRTEKVSILSKHVNPFAPLEINFLEVLKTLGIWLRKGFCS